VSGTWRASSVKRAASAGGTWVPTCGIEISSGRVPWRNRKGGSAVEKGEVAMVGINP
jgi:hypothetical protein